MKYRCYTMIGTVAVWGWHRASQARHKLGRIADWAEQKAWNT